MKVSWIVATFLSTAAPIAAAAAAQVSVFPGVPVDSSVRITPDAESFRNGAEEQFLLAVLVGHTGDTISRY